MPFFAGRRMASVTTADVRTFVAQRQAETILVQKERELVMPDGSIREMPEERRQVSNGEINRELTILKRAFSLALQAGKLLAKPHISMLRESNVRTGFFEREQFEAVCRRLPPAIQPVVRFAYVTGWRITSEVLPLEWRQIDFSGSGEIRLDVGTTKNDEGRIFPITRALRLVLEEQRRSVDALAQAGVICRWVFHRNGRPIKTFIKAWRQACRDAGTPGKLQHDFRRTAVRNLVRAGVPERVAMQMTGHKTRSVFERYNIVSSGDLQAAAHSLDTSDAHEDPWRQKV
jgi:integrase